MTQLPAFYWLPKMHRFIAESSSCTTKPLSQLLMNCLNLIIQHYKEYNEGILKNSGANCFWIINKSTQVLNKLAKLNNTTTAKHFDSFDFLPCILTGAHRAFRTGDTKNISTSINVKEDYRNT